MRRLLTILIVLVIVGGGIAFARQALRESTADDPPTVQIIDATTIERGDLRLTVSATGALVPEKQVALLFEASGIVREVLVEAGDAVQAGDPLARLDTSELEAALNDALVSLDVQNIAYDALFAPPREEDLAAARAALNVALAQLNAAYSSGNPNQAEIARLQSELARNQLWQAQLQRDAAVSGSGFTPSIEGFIPDDLDIPPEIIDQINQGLSGLIPSAPAPDAESFAPGLRQAEYGVAIADANAAAAANQSADPGSVAAANAAAVQARAQLDQLESGADDLTLETAAINLSMAQLAAQGAQQALDRAVLVAPFDGVVGQVNLVEGEPPPSQLPAVLLIDDGALYVDLAIDETDIVRVAEGQAVELAFDALPDATITGRVVRVALTPTVVGTLVTYAVRVALDPTDAPVRLGMSATATLLVDQLDDVLILSNRFIRIERSTQQAYVTIEDANGRYREVPVKLGLRNEIDSQITDGLEAGQRIVLLPRASFDPIGG